MTYRKFSRRQKITLTWWNNPGLSGYDGIVCDGSVRSGKTISMTVGFLLWSMASFNGQSFALCGRTIESLRRNVTVHIPQWLEGLFTVTERRSENRLVVSLGSRQNTYYLFGGRDESSYTLIQGITLAGVLLDEVALMPRSFVEQALARCSVEGSRFWFNCNPASPAHWFYQEWILKHREHNLFYLHFTMADNPSLSPAVRKRYESMYGGVFYERYILGRWRVAEGAIYRVFADDTNRFLLDEIPPGKLAFLTIGIDFGGNRSLTTFVATGFHKGYEGITVVKDRHIEGRKGEIDADRVNRELIAFYRQLTTAYPNVPVRFCFADSEAQYLINSLSRALKQACIPLTVRDSAKYPITQRIVCVNTLMAQGRFTVLKNCAILIRALQTAVWDSKAAEKGKDVRLDDFTSDIDILDAFEYSFERLTHHLLPNFPKKEGDM